MITSECKQKQQKRKKKKKSERNVDSGERGLETVNELRSTNKERRGRYDLQTLINERNVKMKLAEL